MGNPTNDVREAKPSRPLRILMLHNHYLTGGGEASCFNAEVRLLREAGHTVEIYERDNSDVEKQGKLRTAVGTLWNGQSRREVEAILAAGEKFDVMHVHNFFPLISPSVYGVARAAGVAVVQTLHNYRLLCANALLARDGRPCELCLGKAVGWQGVRHRCYRNSLAGSVVVAGMSSFHKWRGTWTNDVDLFVVPSEVTKRKFLEGGFDGGRITVKPNVVECVERPGGAAQRRGVIYAGRLSEEKGVRTLIRAWVEHEIAEPLVIVGDGPLMEELRAAATGNAAISFAGWVKVEQVSHMMAESELLILPTECYESFGLTVLEAYAMETPVIATKGTAPGDLIRVGESGEHVEMSDSDDLARVVGEFFSQGKEKRRAMGRAARRVYEDDFSREMNLRLLEEVYEDAMGRQPGKRA